MLQITEVMEMLRERGWRSEDLEALRAYAKVATARPGLLEGVAAIAPDPPHDQPMDLPAEAWCMALLHRLLETGEAPVACFWIAVHFPAFVSMCSAWARSGAELPPISPFVYAMQ